MQRAVLPNVVGDYVMSDQINTRREMQERVIKKGGGLSRHSSSLSYLGNILKHQEVGIYCYSSITCCSDLLSQVFLFFTPPDENQKAWADYIVNRSIFADAFLTKDLKEGFELGFEVDTFAEYGLMKAGMIALRHAFEFDDWDFKEVVDMGFSETEAYALVSKYVNDEGELENRHSSTNHMIFEYDSPYEAYEGKYYTPEFGGGTSLGKGNHTPFKKKFSETFNLYKTVGRNSSGMWNSKNLMKKLNLMKGV